MLPQRDYFLIRADWVAAGLWLIAVAGALFGFFSFLMPGLSIRFYQWVMEMFCWKVEPIYPDREIGNTRRLGLVMFVISLLIPLVMKMTEK